MVRLVRHSQRKRRTPARSHLLVPRLPSTLPSDLRDALVAFLDGELGTSDLSRAETYMEDPLRMVTHLIMSTPEYQIN